MSVGDTISIDTGSSVETRKIASLGTAAGNHTTLWQPLPDGPVITFPAGSTNVPITNASGFVAGEKIALGYGATYPTTAQAIERYEVATVTAVGKPGTQAYLAADAAVGATNIKVTSVANISTGDKIRLDIDSVGHGIETVTVSSVGTQANRTNLTGNASAGATNIKVRNVNGFAVGATINIGTPANMQTVNVSAVGTSGPTGTGIDFSPALAQAHIDSETVVEPGTGLGLAAPLKFNHAANMPFSSRGTGITFQPATAFSHSSNEPIQALGTGITLDAPLSKGHEVNAAVRDSAVTTAGYQGMPAPSQWFGGPELTTATDLFGRPIVVREGNIVLRDASGNVADSLNYGGLVDPWASEGYQAGSGFDQSGCYVTAPGPAGGFDAIAAGADTSAGRFPDGADTDSNCTDFVTEPATSLAVPSIAGATNIKVASVTGFGEGETIRVGSGADVETAVITVVGTAGGSTLAAATTAGTTVIPVASVTGFNAGQTITIDSGTNTETAIIASIRRYASPPTITITAPFTLAHAVGAQVSGTGITLSTALTREHARGVAVAGDASTPGAPNHYYRRPH